MGHSLIKELNKVSKWLEQLEKDLIKIKLLLFRGRHTLLDVLEKCVSDVDPDVAINCISLRDVNSATPDELRRVFSDFPKILSDLSLKYGFRLVQISSDAVFSGIKGNYNEHDIPDPIDNYGIAKLEGESINENSLIIRTSMIGHSISGEAGLLDWYIKQKNTP